MQIGITGHQDRPGIDWAWVASTLQAEMSSLEGIDRALTSLAVGSDQVFAECALRKAIPLLAVIPLQNYARFFKGDGLLKYELLSKKSELVELEGFEDPEQAFYAAGRYVVERSDLLFAVWDEKPAAGVGGTADAVAYARKLGKRVVVINPITQKIKRDGE